ncbi:MAG: cytochrome c-type biogenesis protein CcmH [Methylophilaceae bacterium]|nr:cytochrome c-type biogenesis protein CcmH [Methylophilaceae bacterium]
MMKRSVLLVALCLWVPMLVQGVARPLGDDPEVEARLKALSSELRCLVCQNQTLADSSAALAEDLRQEIRALIAQGLSDQEIIDYLVARYGDFVRYRPPLKATTLLLWIGPGLLLAAGVGGLWWVLRRRNARLSDDEEKRKEA